MAKVDASLILTVYNEEKTIERFLESILKQSVLPSEVVIVDGGSSDQTALKVKSEKLRFKKKNIDLIFKVKVGNRSVGRNEAIRLARSDIILITDAGCELDKNWVREISRPFGKVESFDYAQSRFDRDQDGGVDVVAGYYKGKAETAFEKALIPYVLVMPDRVDPQTFLPATRSMAIRKKVWQEAGRFDEKYSHNEDYVFANHLKDIGARIVFQKSAVVYWYPRSTMSAAYHMFWRFAYGDLEAGILRRKVIFIFVRYIVAIVGLLYCFIAISDVLLTTCYILLTTSYIVWAVAKNYTYVRDMRGALWLPVLQIISDVAVISGTIQGGVKRRWDIQKIS